MQLPHSLFGERTALYRTYLGYFLFIRKYYSLPNTSEFKSDIILQILTEQYAF